MDADGNADEGRPVEKYERPLIKRERWKNARISSFHEGFRGNVD